jgi:PAS domain S-box-containing protein
MSATDSLANWVAAGPTEAPDSSNVGLCHASERTSPRETAGWPFWLGCGLVFVGYYLGSKIGFLLTFQPHPVSVLWPPNSILLAALLIAPVRRWWVILLAVLPAHLIIQLQAHIPPAMIGCYFISNCGEALIGAGLLRLFVRRPLYFDNLRDVSLFCLCGGFLGPYLSSFLDAGFVVLNGWGSGTYWEIWRIRFFSNVLTALTLAPAIVAWFTRTKTPPKPARPWRHLEVAVLFIGLVGVSIGALYYENPAGDPVLFYTPLPFLLWAILRFGARGTTTAILTITFFTIWGATHAHGPFSGESPEEAALAIQLFLIAMAIPFLLLGAVVEERGKAAEWFAKAFRCSPDAMWIARRRDATLFDVNEHWEILFGYRRDEAIGRTTYELNLWADPLQREEMLERVEMGPVRDFEVALRKKTGEIVPMLLSSDVVQMPNEPGLIVVARDISDRKRAADAARDLVHASRLAAVGELTASLAHELNQPLTAIASNAAAGRRFLDHGSHDEAMFRELLADVGSDARRASDIIQGIHHLVRKGTESRQLVDLNELIREVLRLLHSDLLNRAVSTETKFAKGLPLVPADPVHLQQVVINLLLNSLEAMQSTPVAKRLLIISTDLEDGSFIRGTVRDHGVGLPPNNPKKVFDHFYTTKPNGMGMGLTIVKSIMEAHEGELIAENTGDGAQFTFRLPLAANGLKPEIQ